MNGSRSGYRLTRYDVFMRLPFAGEAAWAVVVEREGQVLSATSLADRYCGADGACTAYCARVGGDLDCGGVPWLAAAVVAVVAARGGRAVAAVVAKLYGARSPVYPHGR